MRSRLLAHRAHECFREVWRAAPESKRDPSPRERVPLPLCTEPNRLQIVLEVWEGSLRRGWSGRPMGVHWLCGLAHVRRHGYRIWFVSSRTCVRVCILPQLCDWLGCGQERAAAGDLSRNRWSFCFAPLGLCIASLCDRRGVSGTCQWWQRRRT